MENIDTEKLRPRFKFTMNMLSPTDGELILDLGCGEFVVIERLLTSKGSEVVGIDVNRQALRRAKKIIQSDTYTNIYLIASSATILPLKSQCIDKITLLETIEHFQYGMEALCLKEASRVLKKGGVLVLSTPRDSNLLINLLDPHWLTGHRHYKPEVVEKLFAENSFNVNSLLVLGGLLDRIYYLLYLPWHLFWSHLLKRDKEPPMPFYRILCKLAAIDFSKICTHIFLNAVKV